VFPNARTVELSGGPVAVLLLHGWTGWTGRLAPLADRLAQEGFAVRLPRLTGHGTNLDALLRCSWRDWVRQVTDEYIDLQDRFQTVHVAGTSMGALLAVVLAARFPIERIA
jgi:carboxylesterase